MANRYIENGYIGTLENWLASNTFNAGDILNIRTGADVVIDQTPSKYLYRISIQKGKLLVDGANATNPIQVPLTSSNNAIVTDPRSEFIVSEGWWVHPLTFDGVTLNQTFDFNAYWNTGTEQGDYTGGFSSVWVETGVRIPYSNSVGSVPQKGMTLSKKNDEHNRHGMIWDVVDNGDGTGHIDVKFWLGSELAVSESLNVYHHENQGDGTYMHEIWTADVQSSVSIAPDVWQPFLNMTIANSGLSYKSECGNGVDGFVFDNAAHSDSVVFGDGTAGFMPMSGARVRVPMVAIKTADVGDYNLQQERTAESSHTNNARLSFAGGIIDIAGLGHHLGCFNLSRCTSVSIKSSSFALGSTITICNDRIHIEDVAHCISPYTIYDGDSTFIMNDIVEGADMLDCYAVRCNLNNGTNYTIDTSKNIAITRPLHFSLFRTSGGATAASNMAVISVSEDCTVDYGWSFGMSMPVHIFSGSGNIVRNLTVKQQTTQGFDQSTISNSEGLLYFSDTFSAEVYGVTVYGDFESAQSLTNAIDAKNIKVRSINSIDLPLKLLAIDGNDLFRQIGISNGIDIARVYIDNSTMTDPAFQIYEGAASLPLGLNLTDIYCTNRDTRVYINGSNTRLRHIESCVDGLGVGTGYSGFGQDGNGAGNCFADIFVSDTKGFFGVAFLPPTVGDGNLLTIESGKYLARGQGDLDVSTGDIFELEMAYFAIGHEGFDGTFGTSRSSGNSGFTTDETAAYITFTYQWMLDGGAWNGTWVSASGLPASGCEDGVKLKVRGEAIGSVQDVNGLILNTSTTNNSRLMRYPIDQVENTLTLTGLEVGSDIVILDAGTNIVLSSVDQIAGSTFGYTYQTLTPFDIGIIKQGFVTQYIYGYEPIAVDSNLPIKQRPDRNYK